MGKPILRDVIHAHALRNMLDEFTCKTGMSKKRDTVNKHLLF